ncbi:emsy amine-terminus (ENT)/plant tudor-like domain protein [Medicago truncatula]|uniref:Emsy amine-terminus (ENT)/plant tudor-like domain protein n=2 Tax=Medicago truncatula TaxID=3880 RepID=G7JVQ8_MEDTR|nr:emsy amine-terminus (ENT)/plant tudor-like domain protein [Medicago truncatula]
MDYEPYDSSGTDDDLPPTHQNRIPRGGRVSGNGRSAVGSTPYPRVYGEIDMETQIHQFEQEAYSSVLRAFKAQADAITWEKESLITELRKELRLSNEEHRELLGRVNADDTIRRIREWRQTGGHQTGMLSTGQALHDSIPSPTVSASRKKQKITPPVPSRSFGGPSPSFHPQTVTAPHQPSSSAKRGSGPGSKGKKQKPGQILPGVSSVKQFPPSGPGGRNQVPNRAVMGERAGGGSFDAPLIGRKVRTRWPDDNNFYEAVICDYNPNDGRHSLVYDMGTANETWEWVKLSEISPEDIQLVEEEDPESNHRGGFGGPGHGMNRSVGRESGPGVGRGRGVPKGQSRKDFLSSQNGIGKAPGDIQILHTDTLIKEVERVFSANHPDPLEIEKAKKVLKDHEQALVDALARLTDLSDGESDGPGHHFPHGRSMDRE